MNPAMLIQSASAFLQTVGTDPARQAAAAALASASAVAAEHLTNAAVAVRHFANDPAVQQRLSGAATAVEDNFAKAAATMEHLAGVGVGAVTVRMVTDAADVMKLLPGVAQEGVDKAMQFVKEHPGAAIVIAGGVVMIVAPQLVAGPALNAAGFGASGVNAGAIAAGVQSSIGNVAAGSTFAILQSAGAGGAGMAVVAGGVQLTGLAAVVGAILGQHLSEDKPKSKL